MNPTPPPVNLPTIDQLIVLTLRFMAAQLCVAIIVAVPISILWIAGKVLMR